MARPKEKIPVTKTKAFLDRCQHEKDNLRQSVIKLLQKDIGNLLEDETHSDLLIRAGTADIKVHKFILKARSPAIYERLVELSTGEDPDVLVMPSWITHNTVLFILKRLYFVETEPLDEAVDKQDEVLMDYLKSLLIHREGDSSGCDNDDDSLKNKNQDQSDIREIKSGSSDNHVNQLVVNDHCRNNVLHATSNNSIINDKISTTQDQDSKISGCDKCVNKDDKSESSDDSSNVQQQIQNHDKENDIDSKTIHADETKINTGSDTANSGEATYNSEQPSISKLIKLSYGLGLPYEACNKVGEDLLRGYLQEVDTDCQITVSGDHFKAHKCILSARSSYFAAMLGGSWRETDTNITLEGVSPSVVEQLLLCFYGGVVDITDTCSVEEFVMSADMYGIDGVKTVVNSFLRREYCHLFHKICSECEERLPEALSISVGFHMDPLKEKCVEWINRNMVKMWRSKYLAKQPQEILDLCYNHAVEELNKETAIETLLNCQNLHHNVPRLRWSEPLLCLITKLNDSTIEYISCNFIQVLGSAAFHKLDKGLGYKISLLEETFEAVIKSLPINRACGVYHALLLKQIQAKEYLEQDLWSLDYCNFINFLFSKCEDFLKLHVHQVINTNGWELLTKDTQSKLLEGGSFVVLKNTVTDPKKAAKARTDARRNYVPTPSVRKGNKIPGQKTKLSQKTTQTSISTSLKSASQEKAHDITTNPDNVVNEREITSDKVEVREVTCDEATLEEECSEYGAVGGMLNQETTPTTNNEHLSDVIYAEPIIFTAELILLLNVTFTAP